MIRRLAIFLLIATGLSVSAQVPQGIIRAWQAAAAQEAIIITNVQTWADWDVVTGPSDLDGWAISEGCQIQATVTNSPPYVGRINGGTVENKFISTPPLTRGIGSVSYYYRRSISAFTNTIYLQRSTDGSSWTTLTTLPLPTTTYQLYSGSFKIGGAAYLRIYVPQAIGTGYLAIDDITITSYRQ